MLLLSSKSSASAVADDDCKAAAMSIASAGVALLTLVLLQATSWQGSGGGGGGYHPLSSSLQQLGGGYRRRRLGYDNIQGALAPPLRCAVHLAVFLFVWAATICCIIMWLLVVVNETTTTTTTTVVVTAPDETTMTMTITAILQMAFGMAAIFYCMFWVHVQYYWPPVSMPGGPRPHKILRQPQWNPDETFEFTGTTTSSTSTSTSSKSKSGGGGTGDYCWHYQQAAESHETTVQRFSSKTIADDSSSKASSSSLWTPETLLTGEAVGRDIWTTVATTTTTTTTTEQDKKISAAAAVAAACAFTDSNNNNNKEIIDVNDVDVDVDIQDIVALLASGTGKAQDFGKFTPSHNPNSKDQVFRAQQIKTFLQKGGTLLPTQISSSSNNNNDQKQTKSLQETIETAVYFYSMLQTDDGHWSGDYGGPMFLMPGLICAWYIMGRPTQMLSPREVNAMIHYLVVHQQSDGGWGTHIESPSTMFGTVLIYVALRLLGMTAQHAVCVRGRAFIRDNQGALYTSSWAKFYLCLLGCMEWEGHNSVPPELWLLPNWCPFHPGRMWCHARMVYLPMGYLYGIRYVYPKAATDETILSLRRELYLESSYNDIDWNKTRHYIAPMDNYSPIPWTMKILQNILAAYEGWAIFQPFKNWIRRIGLVFCAEYMAAEDLQTNFIDIGPVNKVLNMISAYHLADCNLQNDKVVRHMARVADYLWLAEDGLKMKGYNGSQCWDTSFAIQAIYETGLLSKTSDHDDGSGVEDDDDDWESTGGTPRSSHAAHQLYQKVAQRVWSYMERTQILSTDVSQATAAYKYESAEYRRQFYRHVSQGGWPFSTSAHGWPISDCTGEGLKAVLCLQHHCPSIMRELKNGSLAAISDDRLSQAVNVLLAYQNEDGGFATYENNRGFGWYESLNPSEVFGDIMIDYSYVECSMAALTALADFQKYYPQHERSNEIRHALSKGREFLKVLQRPDGSWYGSWACCFCYASWFGIEGLVACGEPTDSPSILKACQFLLKHQRPNGGWGEDFTACFDKEYPKDGMKAYGDEGSGVVSTAWALMALSMAKCDNVKAIQRGVQYLMKRQLPCGDWPQEGIAGVFNRACGITYTAYRNVFPIWALGRCRATYGTEALDI